MYDIIIIGCGIAGMSAAIYGARAEKKVLIIEKNGFGGQIINSSEVANYPGFINISGYELASKIYDQVMNLNVPIINEEVLELIDEHTIKTNKNIYESKTIIIANGLSKRKLGLYGENDFIGKGISYCATCDGNFYKNVDVAIVGGGNTALEDAIYLSDIVNKLYVIHRKNEFSADKILVNKLLKKDNVIYKMNSNVKELKGTNVLSSIVLDSNEEIKVSGLFVAIGQIPDNLKFSNILKLDEKGFIISNDTRTNIPNIFVAGDTRTSSLKQLITAASDGAVAANNAIKYID